MQSYLIKKSKEINNFNEFNLSVPLIWVLHIVFLKLGRSKYEMWVTACIFDVSILVLLFRNCSEQLKS